MEIDLIKRSIRLDRQRLEDTSSNLLIQKNIGRTAVIGRERSIKERINKNIMALEKELVTLTKKWFTDRDLEHGGRLDKQSLLLKNRKNQKFINGFTRWEMSIFLPVLGLTDTRSRKRNGIL